jgi:ligand-binding sensor domain-containing protein/signal transduction histidine kinase
MTVARFIATCWRRRPGLNGPAIALLLLILRPGSAFAIDPDRSLSQYTCRTWNHQNGFPGNGVNAITQTRDGFLWIGTQKGLVRYDGVEFKVLQLPETTQFRHEAISSLCVSDDGGLWFGIQKGGFGCYRPESGFSAATNESWMDPGLDVFSLGETRDGSMWVGSAQAAARVPKDGPAALFPEATQCISIFEDSKKRVWLGSTREGLHCWQAGKITPFPDGTLTNEIIFAVTEDSVAQIWVGTQHSLRCYGPDLRQKSTAPIVPPITKLLCDSHGVVWIGTYQEGLYRYKDGSYTQLQKSDGLADDQVTALFEDRDGNIWVGTRDGLSVLSDVKLPVFSQTEGLPKASYHGVCASAQGGLWAAGSSGISRLNDGQVLNYSTEAGLSSTWMKLVFEAGNGDLYMVNGNREIEILRDGKVVARHSYQNEWPTGLAEDSQGVVVSIGGKLLRADGDGLTPYQFKSNTQPPFNWIRSLATGRDGSVLVASVNGFFRVKNGEYQRVGQENGLPPGDVLWVCEDEHGAVWAGMAGGLARIEGTQVTSWTREDGLFDNFIRAVIPDDEGRLWAQSSQGIFCVARTNLEDVAGHRGRQLECVAYDGLDAVKTIETADVEYSACKTSDGRIWFPCPQGLVMVDPKLASKTTTPPPVHIERVRVNGGDYLLSRHSAVPPGKGELEVQYTAPTFNAPEKLEFRYRLDGYESGWTEAGSRRSAFYTNLKPGRYKFLVQARNGGEFADAGGDSFEIELLPHYYQTAWFRLLCVGLVLAALGGIIAWRGRHLKQKQRVLLKARDELEAEVRNRTAELKERTLSLETEIEERKRMQLEIERVHRELMEASRLAGMAEVATGVLHNVGNVLNSINVSAALLMDVVNKSKINLVGRTAALLKEHDGDLGRFMTSDPKGQRLPLFLAELSEHLTDEQEKARAELTLLEKNVGHVKEIVAMQQSYGKATGVTTRENIAGLVDDAVHINEAALERHGVKLVREFEEPLPEITVDRHHVVQILVNLIANAKHACRESKREDKCVTVRASCKDDRIKISVIDNGVGIPPENLTRIFNHGFTTRSDGHGFGLHSGVMVAKNMGGELRAESDGVNKGATFTLELPVNATAGVPRPETVA